MGVNTGTKKKPTKKSTKTAAIPFNKHYAKEFANFIYNDKGPFVQALKMCSGSLKEGKEHCAIGEAYYWFVSHRLSRVMTEEDKDTDAQYKSRYGIDQAGSTAKAIDKLVSVANVKPGREEDLASALSDCVQQNDDEEDNHDDDFVVRARNVANIWTDEVVPLLK